MKVIFLTTALTSVVAVIVVLSEVRRKTQVAAEANRHGKHIVLIGASIGRGWNLSEWPQRVNAPDITAEAIAAWQFDKTEALEEVLLRPARKFRPTRTYLKSLFQPPPRVPDLVILKECSAYFPGDLQRYKQKTRTWCERLRTRGVPVMLATVVQVTRERASRSPGKQEAVIEYNRWIREYAREQGIPLLDLERAVTTPDGERRLDETFASPDGTHLNAAAYARLDSVLFTAVRSAGF